MDPEKPQTLQKSRENENTENHLRNFRDSDIRPCLREQVAWKRKDVRKLNISEKHYRANAKKKVLTEA